VSTKQPRLATRLVTYATASLLLWIAVVGAAYWYLRRMLPEAAHALPLTHADSVGLPLLSFAMLVAAILMLANLVAVTVLLRRRRRSRSRPAV
jgi:hypothetical protein